jgi:hypothetical protein
MSLVLVCRNITAARQSQPQEAGDPGDVCIGRMADVAAEDLRYTFGTFLVNWGMLGNGREVKMKKSNIIMGSREKSRQLCDCELEHTPGARRLTRTCVRVTECVKSCLRVQGRKGSL